MHSRNESAFCFCALFFASKQHIQQKRKVEKKHSRLSLYYGDDEKAVRFLPVFIVEVDLAIVVSLLANRPLL